MKTKFKASLALLLALCLALGPAALADVHTTGNVHLRSGPGLEYESVAIVKPGTDLEYLGETSVDERGVAWYEVEYGEPCWISSRYSELDEDEEQLFLRFDGRVDEELTEAGTYAGAPAAIIAFDAEAAEDYIDVSEYYLADLDESAAELGLEDYEEVNSEAPRSYSNEALNLAGNRLVEYIALYGAGYTIYGAAIGMELGQAVSALTEAGMRLYDTREDCVSFEHPSGESSLYDSFGYDSNILLYYEDDRVVEIHWSSYTG